MRGKEKCKALKEIRRQIAEENDIPYVVSQCSYQGECKGTCPKCESELRYLERELAIRQGLGKAVAVVGISASVCGGLTACSPVEMIKDGLGVGTVETAGAMVAPETESELEGDVALPDLEGGMDSGQNRMKELPEEEAETESPIPSLAGEGDEAGRIDEALAGAIPIPEEELVMGELLPSSELQESELQGDIALTEEGAEGGDGSVQMSERTEGNDESVQMSEGTGDSAESVQMSEGTGDSAESVQMPEGTESSAESVQMSEGTESSAESVQMSEGIEGGAESVQIPGGTES